MTDRILYAVGALTAIAGIAVIVGILEWVLTQIGRLFHGVDEL